MVTKDEYMADYRDFVEPREVECLGRKWWVLPGVLDPRKAIASEMFAEVARDRPHRPAKVLVVGSGCGIDAVLAAEKNKGTTAVDINPTAVLCTDINSRKHEDRRGNNPLRVYQSDLFSDVRDTDYDYIYFNTPFVFDTAPLRPINTTYGGIEAAICDEDFKTLRRFLEEAPKHLSYSPLGSGVIISTGTTSRAYHRFSQFTQDLSYGEAIKLSEMKKGDDEFFVYMLAPPERKDKNAGNP